MEIIWQACDWIEDKAHEHAWLERLLGRLAYLGEPEARPGAARQ